MTASERTRLDKLVELARHKVMTHDEIARQARNWASAFAPEGMDITEADLEPVRVAS